MDMVFSGVSLAMIIIGLVEFSKKMGATGRLLTALSMVIGVLFGIGGYIAKSGVPADYAGWFTSAMVGLVYGLSAAGLYDLFDARFPKIKRDPVDEFQRVE